MIKAFIPEAFYKIRGNDVIECDRIVKAEYTACSSISSHSCQGSSEC